LGGDAPTVPEGRHEYAMGHAYIGPLDTRHLGLLRAAARHEIRESLGCNVEWRKRDSWPHQMMTMVGPPEKLTHAYEEVIRRLKEQGPPQEQPPKEQASQKAKRQQPPPRPPPPPPPPPPKASMPLQPPQQPPKASMPLQPPQQPPTASMTLQPPKQQWAQEQWQYSQYSQLQQFQHWHSWLQQQQLWWQQYQGASGSVPMWYAPAGDLAGSSESDFESEKEDPACNAKTLRVVVAEEVAKEVAKEVPKEVAKEVSKVKEVVPSKPKERIRASSVAPRLPGLTSKAGPSSKSSDKRSSSSPPSVRQPKGSVKRMLTEPSGSESSSGQQKRGRAADTGPRLLVYSCGQMSISNEPKADFLRRVELAFKNTYPEIQVNAFITAKGPYSIPTDDKFRLPCYFKT
jgi:hypothetical protein